MEMDRVLTVHLDQLVQEALVEKAERSVEECLSSAYDVLAEDSAETDVESSFAIQAEALLGK